MIKRQVDLQRIEMQVLEEALEVVAAGGVVAVPTDTVYGFAADATSNKAVDKLARIKNRDGKPIAVFVASFKQLAELAELGKKQSVLLKQNLPGRFTFVLKKKPGVVLAKRVGVKTVGVRFTESEWIQALVRAYKKPLAVTSANLSGKPECMSVAEIEAQYRGCKNKPDLALDAGKLKASKPSTVVDISGDEMLILRPGAGRLKA